MAEEYLRKFGGDVLETESAGLEPGNINPYVIEVLREEGIDISTKQTQKVWDLYRAGNLYAYVITVCSREAEEKCPIFPGKTHRINWPFPDPSAFYGSREEILERTRKVRDLIKEMVQEFVKAYRKGEEPPQLDESRFDF
jgi:arsenate reductase